MISIKNISCMCSQYSLMFLLLCAANLSQANECEELEGLVKNDESLAEVRITTLTTEYSNDKKWAAPEGARMPPSTPLDKPFCRVEGVIEEKIRFELWLPAKKAWNGRYLGVGNGGEAGWINYNELQRGLIRNFASASTDTRHRSKDSHWALGHPQRVENFGHRAHHLLAVNVKKIINVFYAEAEKYSYFIGCSGGGLQGLNEVQRYPADYDGIISGAAGYSMVPLSARFILSGLLEQQKPEGNLSPQQW